MCLRGLIPSAQLRAGRPNIVNYITLQFEICDKRRSCDAVMGTE